MGRTGAGLPRLVLVVALLASCGAGGGRSSVGSKDLGSPPIELGVNTRLWGVGSDRLFVLDGTRAAVFDFAGQEWRTLPDAPDLARVQVTSIDETLMLLGSACDGPCDEDELAPISVAALDLNGDGGWKQSDAGLGSVAHYGVGFRDVGQAGDTRILGRGSGLLALDKNRNVREIASPEGPQLMTCVTEDGMQTLVPDAQAADPARNGVLAEATSGARRSWKLLPGSETSVIPVPVGDAVAATCGVRGVLLMTRSETREWDGQGWSAHPSAPEGAVINGSAVITSTGTVVAPIGGGSLTAYANGSWKTLRVAAGSLLHPPILSLAAVGDRLVVFDAPRSGGATGVLKIVTL